MCSFGCVVEDGILVMAVEFGDKLFQGCLYGRDVVAWGSFCDENPSVSSGGLALVWLAVVLLALTSVGGL